MNLHKYADILAKCAGQVFNEMSGVKVDRVALQRKEEEVTDFPLSMVIEYSLRDEPEAKGLFLMGFLNKRVAHFLASAIIRHSGMEPPETFNMDAIDALGEYMNTLIGRTISTWDRMGMPVVFGPPSQLQQAHLTEMEEYSQENFNVTLSLKNNNIDFLITFSNKMSRQIRGQKKILVVEDSNFARKTIVTTLEKAGFLVEQAPDGLQAVKIHKQFQPDLTIMDLVMPGMGGLDAMLSIRENDPDSLFIVLTSSQRKDEVVSAKTIGVRNYLLKPFKPEGLIAAVEKALEQ